MNEGQEKAWLREKIKKAREEHGLSTDLIELIEKYRKLDPQYAKELEGLIGDSPASGA